MELEKPMQELQREIIKETIEAVDELAIPKIIPEVKEKRKKKVLYINADEDHVSLQFRHKKGDLTENEK
ncbi:MAG TPA: hypothetical protein DDX29_06250 [Clostridiales bacterium]|nr:hypothetical protein [Clostridiales bacterium]